MWAQLKNLGLSQKISPQRPKADLFFPSCLPVHMRRLLPPGLFAGYFGHIFKEAYFLLTLQRNSQIGILKEAIFFLNLLFVLFFFLLFSFLLDTQPELYHSMKKGWSVKDVTFKDLIPLHFPHVSGVSFSVSSHHLRSSHLISSGVAGSGAR